MLVTMIEKPEKNVIDGLGVMIGHLIHAHHPRQRAHDAQVVTAIKIWIASLAIDLTSLDVIVVAVKVDTVVTDPPHRKQMDPRNMILQAESLLLRGLIKAFQAVMKNQVASEIVMRGKNAILMIMRLTATSIGTEIAAATGINIVIETVSVSVERIANVLVATAHYRQMRANLHAAILVAPNEATGTATTLRRIVLTQYPEDHPAKTHILWNVRLAIESG